ncbi:MAG TPA: patatin-like phospholipase family protein, partial [Ilumatobacteraceae bacterium]|nr:patatin-like phospholipase family protein [Ilumatobacteraceae bacterium]
HIVPRSIAPATTAIGAYCFVDWPRSKLTLTPRGPFGPKPTRALKSLGPRPMIGPWSGGSMRWHRQRTDATAFAEPRTAFVLSGGGSLGAMQAGQLRALFEAGITPDLVIGVSAGALNGAAIAHRPIVDTAEELARIWRGLRSEYVFRGSRSERAWHVIRRHPHLYRSDGLVDLVDRFLPVADLDELIVDFEAGTVNLDDVRIDYHSAGDPRAVLVASASLPGVFRPVVINGSRHVDGGIAVNLPIQRALDLGATNVYAFDCRAGTRHRLPADLSALAVLTSSITVAREILTPAHDHPGVVRLPAPDTHGIGMQDFSQTGRLITEGYELTSAFLRERSKLRVLPAPSAA